MDLNILRNNQTNKEVVLITDLTQCEQDKGQNNGRHFNPTLTPLQISHKHFKCFPVIRIKVKIRKMSLKQFWLFTSQFLSTFV